MKTSLLVSCATTIALALASPAFASEISFGASASDIGNIADIGNGFFVFADSNPFSEDAFFGASTGEAMFGISKLMAEYTTTNTFPVTHQIQGQSLAISFGALGDITGNITWDNISNTNSLDAQFDGTFFYTATDSLVNSFSPSGSMPIELDITTTTKSLEDWNSTYGPYSFDYGITTDPVPMSEPSALAILGMAFLVTGFFYNRKAQAQALARRKQNQVIS